MNLIATLSKYSYFVNLFQFENVLIFSNTTGNWLMDVVNSCSIDLDSNEAELLSYAQHCRVLLYFWINWEAANFCVTNRLRTPFGKPNSTFRAIEGIKMLQYLFFLFVE